jgi:hypothetical protein
LVIKPLEEDSTPGTVKPVPVSLVEPVAYPVQLLVTKIRYTTNPILDAVSIYNVSAVIDRHIDSVAEILWSADA